MSVICRANRTGAGGRVPVIVTMLFPRCILTLLVLALSAFADSIDFSSETPGAQAVPYTIAGVTFSTLSSAGLSRRRVFHRV